MSFTWLNFFLFFLWLNFLGFILTFSSLVNLLFICEIFWITFFSYFSILSNYYNSIIVFLIAIYILCIATGETTIGLAILILKSSMFSSISNLNNFSKKILKNYNTLKVNLINSKILKKWKK